MDTQAKLWLAQAHQLVHQQLRQRLQVGCHDLDHVVEVAGDGVKLAVDVADADFVEVHQGQRADPGAGQRLDPPRADTADADYVRKITAAQLAGLLPVVAK